MKPMGPKPQGPKPPDTGILCPSSLISEHVSKSKKTPENVIEGQVSLDSFTLELDPDSDDNADDNKHNKDVTMIDSIPLSLCSDKSQLKMKRDNRDLFNIN